MKSLNKSMLIGHLGADPDLRYTAAEPKKAVANFTLATTERWRDGDELREDTQWHRCVAWGKLGELVGEKLRKGSPVFVEGRLKTRKWTDKDNVDRYTTEIVLDDFNALQAAAANGEMKADEREEATEPRQSTESAQARKSTSRRK